MKAEEINDEMSMRQRMKIKKSTIIRLCAAIIIYFCIMFAVGEIFAT